MQPHWITRDLPGTSLQDCLDQELDSWFHPIYLCMASQVRASQDASYVQGASDDTETWSCGLTPQAYWNFQEELLSTTETELPPVIRRVLSLVSRSPSDRSYDQLQNLSSFPQVSVGQVGCVDPQRYQLLPIRFPLNVRVILCVESIDEKLSKSLRKRLLHLKCGQGKLGSRDLRNELGKLSHFMEGVTRDDELVACCPSGKDLSIGVVLAIISLWGHEDGNIFSASIVFYVTNVCKGTSSALI